MGKSSRKNCNAERRTLEPWSKSGQKKEAEKGTRFFYASSLRIFSIEKR